MEQPLVSVICACYNQSKFIAESLESVKNQTYKNLEVIIWDDFSSDNSVEIIENWIHHNEDLTIKFIKNEKNLGICKSLNNAFSFAQGKYLQILALDDILLSTKIEKHVSILESSNDREALVFTDAYLMDDDSTLYQNKFIALHKKYLSLKTGNYFDDLLLYNYVPGMAVLYKMSVLKKIGLWDESLVYEDYDMMLRIAKDYHFIFDEEISVQYRFHQHNTHKTISNEMNESKFKIQLKYAGHDENVDRLLKSHLIEKYKNKKLTGEEVNFFKIVPPKSFRERWILKNKNVALYQIVEKAIAIKNLILYQS